MVTKNVDKWSLSEATVACDVPAAEGGKEGGGGGREGGWRAREAAAEGARGSAKCVTALDRCACMCLALREVIVSRFVSGVVVGRARGTCSDVS